jgi:radical SAM superfamily enzyme YgiQ (UPF0313 family)
MPFAAINMPSLALTQLKAVVEATFPDEVSVEIIYLNQEFAHYLGLDPYESVTNQMDHHDSGLGDWFFRQVAFPEAADNIEIYLHRFYAVQSPKLQMFRNYVLQKRQGLDAFLGKLIMKHQLTQANLVGLTSMFSQNVACMAMARKIKSWNSRVITAIGGANCESPMGQEIIKNVPCIDFVFSGPALRSFPSVLRHLINNEPDKCHSVDGVFTKRNTRESKPETSIRPEPMSVGSAKPDSQGQAQVQLINITKSPALATTATKSCGDGNGNGAGNGKGVGNGNGAPNGNGASKVAALGVELELDYNVRLNYDDFLSTLDDNFPQKKVSPILLFETSRGCWWGEKAHCTFCGLNGASMNYRAMSPDKAIQQFESLFKYAPRCTHYQNVDNILAKNYISEVFPFISPPSDATIFYEVKADLTEEDVKVLAKTRVNLIQPGIEALNTSTLKLMKKGTSVFQNLVLLKNCAMYDVFPIWNLLIGFPGEGEEVYKKYVDDLPLLMHLPPPNGAFPVRFDRYSPYFTKAKEYGLDLQPFDFYEMTYPFSKESLANIAYYFVDAKFDAEYRIVLSRWMAKVKERTVTWRLRYGAANSALPARLYFKESQGQTVVYDSRSGQAVEHKIGEHGLEVLRACNKTKRIAQLAAELGHLPDFDPVKEVAYLQERGLLFQEHERLLSLVLPQKPPITPETPRPADEVRNSGTGVRDSAPISTSSNIQLDN